MVNNNFKPPSSYNIADSIVKVPHCLNKSSPTVIIQVHIKVDFYYNLVISGYVEKLLTELWKVVENESYIAQLREKSPPPLSTTFEQPLKEEAIMKHQTRLAQQ